MMGDTDLTYRDCIEIADACLACGRPELTPEMLRMSCGPEEVKRRLSILTAPPEHSPSQMPLCDANGELLRVRDPGMRPDKVGGRGRVVGRAGAAAVLPP
jgi:hypothetical protein